MHSRLMAISALALILATVASAATKNMNLNRTAKSGIDSLLAYSSRWDRNCKSLPVTINIVRQPANGTITVTDADETLPASTPGSGNTGNCDGKVIKSKKVMYMSKPNFHGTDTVVYDSVGAGTTFHTTVAITVQ